MKSRDNGQVSHGKTYLGLASSNLLGFKNLYFPKSSANCRDDFNRKVVVRKSISRARNFSKLV